MVNSNQKSRKISASATAVATAGTATPRAAGASARANPPANPAAASASSSAGAAGARVTLRDIAARAGVSVMSVSRALRDGGHVSQKTRDRIAALAAGLGYAPDPALAALAHYRRRLRPPAERAVVAFLHVERARHEFRADPLVRQVFDGAAERGRELGYRVEPVWLPDLAKRHHDPSRVLAARGIRGIILSRLPRVGVAPDIDWAQFSCVTFGYSLQNPAFDYVASHHFQDMTLAFARATALGYKRPGYVYSDDFDARTLQQMHGAFLLKQETLAKANRVPALRTTAQNPSEDLRHYIKQHRVDLILSPWPGLLSTLRKFGWQTPRDIGFVDLNLGSPDADISGIYQGWPRIGRAAMDRLNMLLQNNTRGVPAIPEGTVIYGDWVAGKTLRMQSET
jgi:DNA-binding LacI/PurR family transcriptional regulator